ncbi:MAG TPA: polymer-forming cytoskeletal protein, partial [Firmicutes bacterium]|nr:polymer-forming cytoskeletal protein [Bacillota bacterium]
MKRVILFLSAIIIILFFREPVLAGDTLFFTIEETKSPVKEKSLPEKEETKTIDIHFVTSGKKYIGLGNKIIVGDHDILYEDLSLVNSWLIIRGTLNGSINIIFGELVIEGVVNGDINVIGGRLLVKDTAIVNGNISFVGKGFELEEGAIIHGKVTSKRSTAIQILEPLVNLLFSGIPGRKVIITFLWYLLRLCLVLLALHLFRKGIF